LENYWSCEGQGEEEEKGRGLKIDGGDVKSRSKQLRKKSTGPKTAKDVLGQRGGERAAPVLRWRRIVGKKKNGKIDKNFHRDKVRKQALPN